MKPIRGVDFGDCPGGAAVTPRYYFNVNTGSCIAFQGCLNPSGGNNFNSLEACSNNCLGTLTSH